MPDRPQCTKAGRDFLDIRHHRLPRKITGTWSVVDPAEIPQPPPGLRQRHLNVPTAAFARLACPRHHGAERHEVAGGMVEHLRRQFLRTIHTGGSSFGVIEAGRGLHQRIEATSRRPWPGVAIGRQRHIDNAEKPRAASAPGR